jgi:phospholipid transport system transporter-binding protein
MKLTPATLDISAEGVIKVSGDMTFQTVPALRQNLLGALFSVAGDRCLDLAAVGRVDSSALSLWLVCRREASRRGVKLTLHNPPQDLCSIAELVGLEGVSAGR